jgi:hypothetical protein
MHRPDQPEQRKFVLSKRAAIVASIVCVLIVSAAGVAAARYLGNDGGTRAPTSALGRSATSARNPTSGVRSTPAPTPDPKPTRRVSRTPHRGHAARHAHHTTPSPSPAPVSASCTHPQFQTSAAHGGWTDGNYFVSNNMWNASGYQVSQTIYACSYANWYVVANMNNNSGNGAVKTYPNVQETFNNNPAISSFHSISSTFAEKSPHVGIYEDAYDIWINGLATSGSTEVMVWTENFHQSPGGSVAGSASLGGRSYRIWRSGGYIAFVADTNFTSGTVNLLQVFDYIMAKGWMPANSKLSQIDYGAEIVSTNSAPATFTFSNFSVSTSG